MSGRIIGLLDLRECGAEVTESLLGQTLLRVWPSQYEAEFDAEPLSPRAEAMRRWRHDLQLRRRGLRHHASAFAERSMMPMGFNLGFLPKGAILTLTVVDDCEGAAS